MKKILTLAAIALFGISTTFAQTAKPAKHSLKKAPTEAKSTTQKASKKATSTSTKLKADGTPDMRYKENKAVKAAPAGPKKKDGTADMRYKVNKEAAKKKS